MRLPNFFLIGAARSGTSSLHLHLSRHPGIRMSFPKEPNFFLFHREERRFGGPAADQFRRTAIRDRGQYERLFTATAGETAFGDASVNYLSSEAACRGIRAMIPDARIIVLLRQPVERAYASFLSAVRDGIEPCETLEEAWRDEPRRERENWFRCRQRLRSTYHRLLTPWFAAFPRERILVHIFEEFRDDPEAIVRDVYRFLDVDASVPVDAGMRQNESGVIKNPLARAAWMKTTGLRAALAPHVPLRMRGRLYPLVARLKRKKGSKPPLDPEVRARLTAEMEEEIRGVEILLGRDLTRWRTGGDGVPGRG